MSLESELEKLENENDELEQKLQHFSQKEKQFEKTKKELEKEITLRKKGELEINKIKSFLVKTAETLKMMQNSSITNKLFTFENLKPAHLCFKCNNVLEEAHSCLNGCDQNFCKKCLLYQKQCPNTECENETAFPNESKQKFIETLEVTCCVCSSKMQKSHFENHFSQHNIKFYCRGSPYGCQVHDFYQIVHPHEEECKYVLQLEKQLMRGFSSSLFESIQNFLVENDD